MKVAQEYVKSSPLHFDTIKVYVRPVEAAGV
jgi:hypothetical protein